MMKFVFVTTVTTWAFLLGCLFWPLAAVAFTLPGDAAAAADPSAWVSQWWQFISSGHYAAALGPGIMLAVWVLRKYDLKIPKVGPQIDAFFNQPLVAFALPTVLAAFGGFGTAVAAGQPLKAAIEPTIKAAMTAIVMFVMLKQGGQQLAAVKLASDPVPDAKPTAPGGAPANPPPVIVPPPPESK